MRYLFAIILPPVAVLMCGRPFSAIINCLFTLCFWIPGILHALLLVGQYNGDRRNREVIRALRNN